MQVSTHFAVALPATASFDYPTVAALAAYIASKSVAAVVSVPAPAVVGHVTESERVSSTVAGTSDLIGMSSMLATSPTPGEGKSAYVPYICYNRTLTLPLVMSMMGRSDHGLTVCRRFLAG